MGRKEWLGRVALRLRAHVPQQCPHRRRASR